MKVKEAKFSRYISPCYRAKSGDYQQFFFEKIVEEERKPQPSGYNIYPEKDPCEAVLALSIGQYVTPKGNIKVKHFKEKTYGEVETVHISAKNAEELKKKLHAIIDHYIGSYYDFTNGV